MTDSVRKVENAIRQLRDKTAEQVAIFLQRQGVKGYMGNPCECPISVWVKEQTDVLVITGESYISVVNKGDIEFKRVPLPAGVSHFVISFDRGLFPALKAAKC